MVGGQQIGIIGLTGQTLLSLSSPTGTKVAGDPTGVVDVNLAAAQVQAAVDDLVAHGVNKIVLTTDSNSVAFDTQLAGLVHGVDLVVAGGEHLRNGDANDVAAAFPGHSASFDGALPIVTHDADGNAVLVMSSDSEYTYLDRMVVGFDAAGHIDLSSLDDTVNGAYAATDANVAAAWGTTTDDLAATAYAAGTSAAKVKTITDAIDSVITVKDGAVFGYSDVYLEGERSQVRFQETNLGDLSADANSAAARAALGLDDSVALVSIKNGGGIRNSVGFIDEDGAKLPNIANPSAGKPAGAISQLDIENSLRFNNALMVYDTTAQGLLNILNSPNAVNKSNGGFIQIGGVEFSYDPTKPVGSRVQDISLVNALGEKVAVIADNGVVNPNAPAVIHGIVLNFTANGGDGYLFKANATNFRYVEADGTLSAAVNPALDFTSAATITSYTGATGLLGEQKVLEDYFTSHFANPETAFHLADTTEANDLRIQNQSVRADTVLDGQFVTYGTSAAETVSGTTGNDVLKGLAGNDKINGGDGDDVLSGGLGRDHLDGGAGIDTVTYADAATGVSASLSSQGGSYGEATGDKIVNVENLTGSAHDDVLVGNGGDNVIEGGAGDDTLEGKGGADALIGGNGADTLLGGGGDDSLTGGDGADWLTGGNGLDAMTGGAGNDTFVFLAKGDTGKLQATADAILDFVSGQDHIDLSAIDANSANGSATHEMFSFIGAGAFTKVAGQLHYEVVGADSYVSGDLDGNGKADFMIHLVGVTSLSVADFIL